MSGNQAVRIHVSEPQYTTPNRTRDVSLLLDHLEGEVIEGVSLEKLYQEKASDSYPGEKIIFSIRNSVSSEEEELYKFCKEQIKKKKFEAIVTRASELLETHPSSLWAHFFYGVACKKIPDKEKFFVPAITAAVTINPNFLSGWQVLHKHFLGLGGFFSRDAHDEMFLVAKVLLKLDPNYDSWCTVVGQIWDYVMAHDFNQNRMVFLLAPYLNCSCPQRQIIAASFIINFIREKKKLLPKECSNQVLLSFQVLISEKASEMFKLGLLHSVVRYFYRANDTRQICRMLKFIHVNDSLAWKLKTAKEFAYHLIYEMFRVLGEEALDTIVILRSACGEDMLHNNHYLLCNTVFKLTNSYSTLLENANTKLGNLQMWGRLLCLKVLIQLKLYQEAYEQILVDLNISNTFRSTIMEKSYMAMLIDIFSHAIDLPLQLFTLHLGYKYLKMYGFDVQVLHCLSLVCIALKDTETVREILKCLMSMGAVGDTIYLQALLEEDHDIKLDYLKSLKNIPEAYLLSAVIYKDMGKSKRVLKSMLEASFHFHGGITSFEWLGVHYYERDLIVKATRYFLEAFSNYLVSCISVNYIISIYSQHGDVKKTRAFFDTLGSRNAVTTDVACTANLKAGLNFMTKAKETVDFHRALERFRKVTDFSFERKIIEMVADALGYFGMHGSAADFYLMCHAENDTLHIYPSVLYATETKMIKGKGFRYLNIARNVAKKAGKSPLALFTYGSALLDRAVASYSVNNFRHCIFLCQQVIILFSRCIALHSNVATFWISLGNVFFTVSSLHSDFGSVYVPSWLIARNVETKTMVLVTKHESFILALRCFTVAKELSKSEEINQLVAFYIGLSFRYAKTFYKESGDRMLCWALSYALDSCDSLCWQRNNLCGVILTGLGEYRDALNFFKDSMLIGASEDARDAEFNSGIVHLRLGEFTNAHEVFMHRRGNDPMDSLVWQSYMLLHHCLGDSATVLHYLWYLIYSIKHYPSLEQGMEYLSLISSSSSFSNTDLYNLKTKCVLYAIFHTPMFMKMTFVGDCEVPHKFNHVSACNYFFHGKIHSAQCHHSAAKENLHEFLKLVAENNCSRQSDVDEALLMLAMSSESHVSFHDLIATGQTSPKIALAKFFATQAIDDESALNGLLEELPQFSTECDPVFTVLFETFKIADISLLAPAHKKLYAAFISRTLIRQLIGISSSECRIKPSRCCEETVEGILNDIFGSCVPLEIFSSLLSKIFFVNLLEGEFLKHKLQFGV